MLLMMIKNVDADNVDCGLSYDIELLCYRCKDKPCNAFVH